MYANDSYSYLLYRASAEYQIAYSEGFEDCRAMYERAFKKLREIKPYEETTSTLSLKEASDDRG